MLTIVIAFLYRMFSRGKSYLPQEREGVRVYAGRGGSRKHKGGLVKSRMFVRVFCNL